MATLIVTSSSPLGLSLRSLSPVSLPGLVSLSAASRYPHVSLYALPSDAYCSRQRCCQPPLAGALLSAVPSALPSAPIGWCVAVSVAVSPDLLARCHQRCRQRCRQCCRITTDITKEILMILDSSKKDTYDP